MVISFKRKIFFLLYLVIPFWSFNNTYAQSPADSLKFYNPFEHTYDIRRILTNYFSILGDKNNKLINKYSGQIKQAHKNGSLNSENKALINSGDIYFKTGLFENALKDYFLALKNYRSLSDTMNAALTEIKIGRTYYFADLWTSLDYISIGAKVLMHSNNEELVAFADYAMGTVETNPVKARQLFRKALNIQLKIIREKPNDYKTNEELSRYLNALGKYKRAIKVAERINDDWLVVLFQNNLGYSLVLSKKYKQSLPIYFRSLNMCIANRYKTLLRNTYDNIARAYRFMGNYKKALYYREYDHYVEESMYKEQFAIKASEYRVKYRTEEKILENKLLKNREAAMSKSMSSKTRETYMLVFLILLITVVSVYIFFSRKNIKAANSFLDKQNNEIKFQKSMLEGLNRELQTSEENLKIAQATAHLANWEWDFKKDILTFSDELPNLFGVDPEKLKTNFRKVISEVIHPNDRRQFMQYFYGSLDDVKDEDREYRILKGNEERWIFSKRRIINDSNNHVFKIFGTVQDITDSKAEAEIKINMAVQQSFTNQLIEQQEEERKRIAGELHDSIGQDILLIKNRAQLALQNEKNDSYTNEQLNEINNSTSGLLNLVRQIAFNLRPAHLERLGLTETIISAVQKVSEISGINISHKIENIDNIFPADNRINFFRIIQEGMNNIVKHSYASNAVVEVYKNKHSICLNISDNGQGFDSGIAAVNGSGFGLNNIMNRVKILNGTVTIITEKSKGTKLTVTIPV